MLGKTRGKIPNYYEILQVSPTADGPELAKAYKRLVKMYHPDCNATCTSEDKKAFYLVNEAYSCLSKAKSRRAYDRLLRKSIVRKQAKKAVNDNGTKWQKTGYNIHRLFDMVREIFWPVSNEITVIKQDTSNQRRKNG